MAQITLNSSGVASSGSLLLQTNGTTTQATVDTSGNLGLGVTPSSWDSTYKALQVGSRSMFYGIGSEANMANNAYYNAGYKYVANSAAGLYTIDANVHKWYYAPSGTAGNAITFTQAMTLDSSGNLGVGTTSPSQHLEISGTSTQYILATSTNGANAGIRMNSSGNRDFGIFSDGAMRFYDFTAAAERARIDSSGNLLVGTTSGSWTTVSKSNSGSYSMTITNPNYGSGDGCLIVKAGNGSSGPYIINCESNSAAVFRVYGNGTYGTVSDLNLKKNIETARNYLSDLMQLRVVKYNWKVQDDTEPKELGFIAQEVEQVFPGLVETSTREGEMDNKLIKQPVLIPMLVKAIQELKAEFDAYKAAHP